MKRIDVHTHLFHPAVAAKALARLAQLGFPPCGNGQVADLLDRADRAGIDLVVAHNVATTPGQMRPVNRHAVRLQEENERVLAFGSVHPGPDGASGWEAELDRLRQGGIRGIKWHPNFQNLALDSPLLDPIIEAAQGDFVFLCHVGCEEPLARNPASPWRLRALVRRHPQARFVAAHMGGYGNARAAMHALGGEDIWVDCSNTGSLTDGELAALFRAHDPERILFGSDYPLFDPQESLHRLQSRLRLSDSDMLRLTTNAGALLGLS